MRGSIIFLFAASILTVVPKAHGQGSCVLASAGAPIDSTASLTLNIHQFSAAPGYTSAVPMRQEATGQCRIRLTPRGDATQFRIDLTITRTGGVTPEAVRPPMSLQLVARDSSQIQMRMVPLQASSGARTYADVTIRPLVRGAREYPLALVVSRDTLVYMHPVTLLWAPEPDIQVGTARSSCGAEACLYAGREQELDIRGADILEVNTRREARIGLARAGEALSPTIPAPLRSTPEGLSIPVTPTEQLQRVVVALPLAVHRLRFAIDGTTEEVESHVDTVSVLVVPPPATQVTLSYASGGALNVLRGGSRGLRVRLQASEDLGVTNRGRYQLRELVMGVQGAPVAELFVDVDGGTSALGTIIPVSATRTRAGRDGAPELVMPTSGSTELRIPLDVLPETRVDRVFVRRVSRGDEQGAALHPMEEATLRLEGPAVGYLQSGEFAGQPVNVRPRPGVRDSVEVSLKVPRGARHTEVLRLVDGDGAEVAVPITVEPNQRPNPRISDFLKVEYRQGSRRDTVAFPGNEQQVSTLGGVSVIAEPAGIDGKEALFGVQYLQLDVDLYDAAGNRRGTHSRCLAIVPPPIGERPYKLTGNCTRVVDGVVSISDLIDASTRATAQSMMRLRVRHDAAQYPHDDVGEVKEVRLRRRGRLVVEPRLQLPGPVMALQRGRTTAGVTYTGALLSIQPLLGGNWLFEKARVLSFQNGFILGTAPSTGSSGDGLTSRLSLTSGASFTFRDMVGEVSLDFFGGRVWPLSGQGLRERDAYWVFRPGFSIPLSKPSS